MRLPLALLLVLVLTGCSGDDDRRDAAPAVASPSVSASASSSPSPSRQASPSAGPTVAPAPSPAVSASAAPPAAGPAGSSAVRLIGDGVDVPSQVVVFGTPYDAARAALDLALGAPSRDTGRIDPASTYGACPGDDLRVLEYGDGALRLLFGTVDGPATTFYGWLLSRDGAPGQVPPARALVGDQATYEFGVGTEVAELQEGLGATLTLNEGDELSGPSFRVADQSGGFFGFLQSAAPSGEVDTVQAGDACTD